MNKQEMIEEVKGFRQIAINRKNGHIVATLWTSDKSGRLVVQSLSPGKFDINKVQTFDIETAHKGKKLTKKLYKVGTIFDDFVFDAMLK